LAETVSLALFLFAELPLLSAIANTTDKRKDIVKRVFFIFHFFCTLQISVPVVKIRLQNCYNVIKKMLQIE